MRRYDRIRSALVPLAALIWFATAVPLAAGDLTRVIRSKLSAGDLRTGEAAAEEWRAAHGEDAEYLDGLGWLARGALLLGDRQLAIDYVAELRRKIPAESDATRAPLGAAIEVEGRVILARQGRGAAIAYWQGQAALARHPALRARIWKNIDLVALEGSPAPEVDFRDTLGPNPGSLSALAGRPVLLFFWAEWCGDCKAQAPAIARLAARYGPRGLAVVAPTRFYDLDEDQEPAAPAEERKRVAATLLESYAGFESIPVPISEATMTRYGASATPTLALLDRRGVVRLYTPTRLSERQLERRIEELLAE